MMNAATVIEITRHALTLVLVLSLPVILVAGISALLIAVLQAVTQIQDQSIGLTVRMIAVMVTVLLMAGWAGQELLRYAGGALELALTGRPGLL